MGWMRMRVGGVKAENRGGTGAGIRKGGMSGVAWSWSAMKLKEADVDNQVPYSFGIPTTCEYHWACVQGKYPVVVVVGAWVLSE